MTVAIENETDWQFPFDYEEVIRSVISEALGHDSERTTRIYLASVSTTRVDKANSKIIDLL